MPLSIVQPTSEQEAKAQPKALYDQALKLLEDTDSENQRQGITLLTHAGNSNFVDAQVMLAKAYQTGKWVKQNSIQAARWYEKAANHGHGEAQYALGWIYFNGEGVPKDMALSFYWFDKAARDGDAKAKSAKTFVQAYLSPNSAPPKNLIQIYKDSIQEQMSNQALKSKIPKTEKPEKTEKTKEKIRMAGR